MTPQPTPTDGELAILRVLWSRGAPMTVREVHDALGRDKDTAYTTVLKMLTIMFENGLVLRDEAERSHRFVASRAEPVVESSLVDDFVQRTLGGSAVWLVQRARRRLDAPAAPARMPLVVIGALALGAVIATQLSLPRDMLLGLRVDASTHGALTPGTYRDITADAFLDRRHYHGAMDADGRRREGYEENGEPRPIDPAVRAGVVEMIARPTPAEQGHSACVGSRASGTTNHLVFCSTGRTSHDVTQKFHPRVARGRAGIAGTRAAGARARAPDHGGAAHGRDQPARDHARAALRVPRQGEDVEPGAARAPRARRLRRAHDRRAAGKGGDDRDRRGGA
jgi:BlaI family penicillinase repressor